MDNFIAIEPVWDENGQDWTVPVYYKDFVGALAKPLPRMDHMNHMALGVAGESGELVDAIKKHTIYGKGLDRDNVIEELGDLAFYMQGLMTPLNITWVDIVSANVVKLRKRYATGTFSVEQAQARADKVVEIYTGLTPEQQAEIKSDES